MVVSDSHGDAAALTTILDWAKNANIDAAVFLGDGYDDLAEASARTGFVLPWHVVRGNEDHDAPVPDRDVLEIRACKIFLCHGHRYHVGEGYQTVTTVAQNAGAEAALFGHTHVPHCATVDGILLLNPGSISRPRSNAGCTFAVLECPDSGPCSARFLSLMNHGRTITEL